MSIFIQVMKYFFSSWIGDHLMLRRFGLKIVQDCVSVTKLCGNSQGKMSKPSWLEGSSAVQILPWYQAFHTNIFQSIQYKTQLNQSLIPIISLGIWLKSLAWLQPVVIVPGHTYMGGGGVSQSCVVNKVTELITNRIWSDTKICTGFRIWGNS